MSVGVVKRLCIVTCISICIRVTAMEELCAAACMLEERAALHICFDVVSYF